MMRILLTKMFHVARIHVLTISTLIIGGSGKPQIQIVVTVEKNRRVVSVCLTTLKCTIACSRADKMKYSISQCDLTSFDGRNPRLRLLDVCDTVPSIGFEFQSASACTAS